MPASDISRLSLNGLPKSDLAANYARSVANYQVGQMIQNGFLDQNDLGAIRKEYKAIYLQEYYKSYANFLQKDQQSRIVYTSAENASARKYSLKHTVANFSKLNCFIHVHRNCITVGRFSFPLDEENSLETKEAFLTTWPGPLDRPDEYLKRRVTNYIDTLWQHDSQRRIRYCSGTNDDQRKVILKFLTELLHRNGTIDASGVTRLLLRPEQTEIQRDESNRKPWETLQKYLLLGKRTEAIRFAKSRKLWDHAQCLAFLDKYQPPNTANYVRDGPKLKEDFIVQLNDEYINSIDHRLLNTVYRSLLNRILQSEPDAGNIIKHPNVGSNEYEFAILSANDCEMEFDQTNEIFKLITAVKHAMNDPASARGHLISLGYSSIDSHDPSEDLSYRSHLSFNQGDTHASRTLTISNIDMLILNEIWEYCLNLAKGTCNPTNFEYLLDLVPYKLIFASKLLDFGLHNMFAHYLSSIRSALTKAGLQNTVGDQFYDWSSIQRCVDHLDHLWEIFRTNPDTLPYDSSSPESLPHAQPPMNSGFNFGYEPPPPPLPSSSLHSMNHNQVLPQSDYNNDYPDSAHSNYPSMPYQGDGAYNMDQNYVQGRYMQQNYVNPPIQEEVNDFSPEVDTMPPQSEERNLYNPQPAYNDYSEDLSRRPSASQSMEAPVFSPPQPQAPPGMALQERPNQKQMTSSSPVHKGTESMPHMMGDSFSSPFSPINREEDIQNKEGNQSRRASLQQTNSANEHMAPGASSSNPSGNKLQNPAEQQASFFTSLVGRAKAVLPKSNSKHMILPDDSNKTIVYDANKGGWVDTTQPESTGAGAADEAPPMFRASEPPKYSFAAKSSKMRYPQV